MLDHAISNVISNAIKYSRNNSHVKIIGKILEDCIAIRVIDTGIGIPAKDLENIGKKFFRAGNSILVAGTGIGIYLTKHFIDLLAGKIIIESKENLIKSFVYKLLSEDAEYGDGPKEGIRRIIAYYTKQKIELN